MIATWLRDKRTNELRWPNILLPATGLLLLPLLARLRLRRRRLWKRRMPTNPGSSLRKKSEWRNSTNTNSACVCRVMRDLTTARTSRLTLASPADSRWCVTRVLTTTTKLATSAAVMGHSRMPPSNEDLKTWWWFWRWWPCDTKKNISGVFFYDFRV